MRLIDADSLISGLEEWKENPNNDDSAVDLVNHFIGIIKAAPSANAVQRWIPCSERLPETPKHYYDRSLYLTCNKTGYITSIYWWDGWNCLMEEDGTIYREHEIKDIVAWMPLPTPYKGGAE